MNEDKRTEPETDKSTYLKWAHKKHGIHGALIPRNQYPQIIQAYETSRIADALEQIQGMLEHKF